MADDNRLTRRRVLSGIGTIGAAGALGAGTWAAYSDTETKRLATQAGTLDLKVEGEDGQRDSQDDSEDMIHVQSGPLAPGEAFTDVEKLTNTGSVAGQCVSITIGDVSSSEVENPESETNTGGNGELDDQLGLRAALDVGDGIEFFFGGSDSIADFDDVRGETFFVNEELPKTGTNDESGDDLIIQGLFRDRLDNNAAQGDRLEFDVAVRLYENRCEEGSKPDK